MDQMPGPPSQAARPDTNALLLQILDNVEDKKRKRWVEVTCAIVLSLATTASAWCAYEATRWSGVQTFRLAASNKASREASSDNIVAIETRAFDGNMIISYLEARSRGDKAMETLLLDRFRPETKKGLEAWLKTDPFNNPAAPLSPFKMKEYVQPELEAAQRHAEAAEELHIGAQQANETSDTYVLLTVMFSSVLFFGGIGGTFDSPRLRTAALVISLLLLTFTLFALETMPICRE